MTIERPSSEREVSVLRPAMALTDSSILRLISVSTVSGEAPGYSVVTTTIGKSTLGNWSTPSWR